MKRTKSVQHLLTVRNPLASVVLTSALAIAPIVAAQAFQDLQTPESPLVLQAQGSFYVGGETVEQTANEVAADRGFPADKVTINQMYVEYMIPQEAAKVPVVMVHGATLSGKTYDTTPDGRMGWYEYFVRQDHPVYVPDQVGRARSGFNQAIFNNVRAEITPPTEQPSMFRLGDNFGSWTNFRFGPEPGVAYPETQFPVEAAAELSKQSVPDLSSTVPTPNPTYEALSDLATDLNGAVLLGHSQSGAFPLEAALTDATGVRGMVMVEPGSCDNTEWTDEQIVTLADIPVLVVFGDHTDQNTQLPSLPFLWQESLEDCQTFVARVNDANGNAQMMHLPEMGISGSSHMLMQDKNNLEIADMILEWIDENVDLDPSGSAGTTRKPRG